MTIFDYLHLLASTATRAFEAGATTRGFQSLHRLIALVRATAADPAERVPFVKQLWFYNDRCTPYRNRKTHRHGTAILAARGRADQSS